MKRISWLLLLLGITAAGCSSFGASSPEKERQALDAQNIPPQNYKPDLLAFLRTYLNNPEGVREAGLSEPRKLWILDIERYAACLRYNAKDSTGRYTGLRDHVAVFVSGKFDRLIELGRVGEATTSNPSLKPLRDFCATAGYQPLPELEKLRL